MPSLTFEGESHGEIVQKVRRWLQSVEHGEEVTKLTPAEAVERGAELTKDALQIIAAAAPERVASNEVVKALTGMGYKATEQTKDAVISALDSIEEMTGGSVLKRVEDASRSIVYEMNATMARQILKALKDRAAR
ncbi:MAG TPA: hypothetical protein VM262_18875 [Acidimicrobiales bacterium]|nr:hypothetical protein [Acidimicrobiales bacterium]